MSSNENILAYINKYFKNNNILDSEIDKIFNDLSEHNCSIPYDYSLNITINGVVLNYIDIINLVYLIPNLFRKCYSKDTATIPSLCPKFTFNSGVTFYYPILIDEKLIKSFLYFNFPSNIYNYTFNDAIKNITERKQNIIQKKKNTNYGSFTNSSEIFNILYDKSSLLNQLILFNKYINLSESYVFNNKILNNFEVIWDFTSSCISYTQSIDDTYIIGNNSSSYFITELTAKNLFDIRNLMNDLDVGGNFFYKTIYLILNYAEEVYQDVLLEMGYFMNSKEYCKKDYMYINNIPELISIYNNFYKNQVYSNSKELIYTPSNNIVPQVNTINNYINRFIIIYKETYNFAILLKRVIISKNNGFVFFLDNLPNVIIDYTDYYIYYYINTSNPSPIQLNNVWKYSINYSESGINTFVSNFIYGYNDGIIIWIGYLKYIKALNYIFESYPGGGLYPQLGNDYTNSNNIGYYYYFYNNSKNLISTVYLTLRTIDTTPTSSAYGVALVTYKSN
jgi:hypothetical protein